VSQTRTWEQREAEAEQARALLKSEVRRHVEREDGLKAKCTAFELQLTRIDQTLAQTRARVAAEEAGRAAAEDRVEALSQLQIAAGRELAERARQEKKLRLELEGSAKRLSDQEARMLTAETLVGHKTKSLQTAEARVAELVQREASLERELVRSQQTNQSLTAKTDALATAQQAAAAELVELRDQAARRASSEEQLRRELEAQVVEQQRGKDELARAVQAANQAGEARQQIIRALESQFKDGLAKLTSL
jgi:chromosome segregation ATPase